METVLEEINQTPGVFGSMVVGKDGLVVANIWNQEIDLDMIGADTADILNTIEPVIAEKFLFGTTELLSIDAEGARLFLKNIDDSTFLAVATSPRANIGLLRAEINAAAAKLEEKL